RPPPRPPAAARGGPGPRFGGLGGLLAGRVVGAPRAPQKRLEAAGFTFRWYDLEEALGDVVQ
ncbi:DUF1731 domain-containing protein, partial [Enterobacter hormaechei]